MSGDSFEQFFNSDSLSENFFAEIVEIKLKVSRDSFKVKLILIAPATGKNENFASLVYRAKIKVQFNGADSGLKVIDVILKASLTNVEELDEYGVFPRERFMYESILSSFEGIWLESSGEEIQFAPQGIKFVTEPHEIIVLDDLKASGYRMLDRKDGLTLEQGKLLLTKLAKFHAISAWRYQREGIQNSYLDRASSKIDPDGEWGRSFLQMFKQMLRALERFGEHEEYIEKFKKFDEKSIFNTFLNDDSPMRCGFKVLAHADLWTNNAMFKFDGDAEETPVDVLILDFQMSFWGSPTIDLMNFILTSINEDFRTTHFDEFIEVYHRELSSALKIIGYEQHIPSLEEMHEDIMEKRVLAVMVPAYLFFMKNSANAFDLEALMGEQDETVLNGLYEQIYQCPVLKKSIASLLPFLNERGFLEPLTIKEAKTEE